MLASFFSGSYLLSLKLIKDEVKRSLTFMCLFLLELLSCEPLSTEVAIYLQLRTFWSDVLPDAFKWPDLLQASHALDDEALTFIVRVLLQVLKENALLRLVLIALMQYLDLPYHLLQQPILNGLIYWRCDRVAWHVIRRTWINHLLITLILRSLYHRFLSYGFTIVAFLLSDTLTTGITIFKITYKTDDLVAIIAFFWFQWYLFAYHTRYVINEFLLKVIHRNIRISS